MRAHYIEVNNNDKKKKHLYICNGAAYSFYDYQLDLISALLRSNFRVTLIQYDYFISDLFLKYINDFKKDSNFNFLSVQQLVNFSSHRSLIEIIKKFNLDKPDLIILTSDTTIFSRYLINYAKNNDIEIGLLQQTFLDISLLNKEVSLRNNNLNKKREKSRKKNKLLLCHKLINKYKSFKNKPKELILSMRKLIIYKIRKYLSISLNFYIYPFILRKKFFVRNNFDKYTFCAGRVDFVMCQKQGDIDILKKFITKKSKYYLISNKKKTKPIKSKSKSALFILGCIYRELDEEAISYLNQIGSFLKVNNMIDAIDLRLHPRMDPGLKWPNLLKSRLERSSIKVNILRAEEVPLIDICGSYAGIVSSFTSSLKICEQNSDKFIVCVLNVSGKRKLYKEEAWMLGPNSGINIIDCGDKLSNSIFERKNNVSEAVKIDHLIPKKLSNIL